MGMVDKVVKKQKQEDLLPKPNIVAHFLGEDGDYVGPPLDLPQSITVDQLNTVLQTLVTDEDAREDQKYCYFINDVEVTETVGKVVEQLGLTHETKIDVQFRPQAMFTVRAVGRCGGQLTGHGEAVISAQFSPDGKSLASGSGDTTVRFWDLGSYTPRYTGTAHRHWVLCVAWSPCGKYLASGGKDNSVVLWDPRTGTQIGKVMTGHRSFITGLAWEPIHIAGVTTRLASSSKDGSVFVWNIATQLRQFSLSSHTRSVTCLSWGGKGYIYTGSQDRTIKVWNANDGTLLQTLEGHAHWINTMAVNAMAVLRSGAFDHYGKSPDTPEEVKKVAASKYEQALKATNGIEMLVTGSDDFTMYLWDPLHSKKPLNRLTGHQQLINHVAFSPDARYLISASFDKSIRLYDAKTGKHLHIYRGHVGAVYQVAWSADSRLFVSASKDSTMKVWSISKRKQVVELPGHADEVYTVDWSPDGSRVVSGSKDKLLKIWTN